MWLEACPELPLLLDAPKDADWQTARMLHEAARENRKRFMEISPSCCSAVSKPEHAVCHVACLCHANREIEQDRTGKWIKKHKRCEMAAGLGELMPGWRRCGVRRWGAVVRIGWRDNGPRIELLLLTTPRIARPGCRCGCARWPGRWRSVGDRPPGRRRCTAPNPGG